MYFSDGPVLFPRTLASLLLNFYRKSSFLPLRSFFSEFGGDALILQSEELNLPSSRCLRLDSFLILSHSSNCSRLATSSILGDLLVYRCLFNVLPAPLSENFKSTLYFFSHPSSSVLQIDVLALFLSACFITLFFLDGLPAFL